jgi:hypothetical protein
MVKNWQRQQPVVGGRQQPIEAIPSLAVTRCINEIKGAQISINL